MKKIFILIFSSILLLAEPNYMVSAKDLALFYANYKSDRELNIERNILKPRFENFSGYLFRGVVELKKKKKSQAIAYSATLSLISKKNRNIYIPNKYENLEDSIKKEIKLILEAKKVTISPVLGVKIDYRSFKVPLKYKSSPEFYRGMRFAQIMPFVVNPTKVTKVNLKHSNQLLQTASILYKTIQSSQRLRNLYRNIDQTLNNFVGEADDLPLHRLEGLNNLSLKDLRKKLNQSKNYPVNSDMPFLLSHLNPLLRKKATLSIRLFPTRYTIDGYIFSHRPKPKNKTLPKATIEDIIKVIDPKQKVNSGYNRYPIALKRVKKEVDKALFNLNSSYKYDFKIMQTFIKNNYLKAFKFYYKAIQTRTQLYQNRIVQKDINKKLDIAPNLTETLSVMIEGALMFSFNNQHNKIDKKMVETLKKLRVISLKKEQKIPFSKEEKLFLLKGL